MGNRKKKKKKKKKKKRTQVRAEERGIERLSRIEKEDEDLSLQKGRVLVLNHSAFSLSSGINDKKT